MMIAEMSEPMIAVSLFPAIGASRRGFRQADFAARLIDVLIAEAD